MWDTHCLMHVCVACTPLTHTHRVVDGAHWYFSCALPLTIFLNVTRVLGAAGIFCTLVVVLTEGSCWRNVQEARVLASRKHSKPHLVIQYQWMDSNFVNKVDKISCGGETQQLCLSPKSPPSQVFGSVLTRVFLFLRRLLSCIVTQRVTVKQKPHRGNTTATNRLYRGKENPVGREKHLLPLRKQICIFMD